MAFDAFLKIEGIDGDSADRFHPNEIEVESFSWGESLPTTIVGGGGGGAGKVSMQDFHFTMSTSKASPSLMLACATGRHFQKATLTCRKAGFEFVKIRLDEVVVSSYQLGAHAIDSGFSVIVGTEDHPTDQMSLAFAKIDFLYSVQRTGETVEASFDQVNNA